MTEDNRIQEALATLRRTASSLDAVNPELATNLRCYAYDFERRREPRLEDNRITQIREVMRYWDRPHDLDRKTALERIRAILDSAPVSPVGGDTEAHLRLPIAAPLAGIPGREHHIVAERPECNADTCECES